MKRNFKNRKFAILGGRRTYGVECNAVTFHVSITNFRITNLVFLTFLYFSTFAYFLKIVYSKLLKAHFRKLQMLDYRKLTRNGQLTLPSWFRTKYHLDRGELIELVEVEEGLLLKPLKSTNKKSAVQELIEVLDAAGDKMKAMTEEEVMELVNQEIKALRKKNENSH